MLYLAREGGHEPTSARRIAQACDLPDPFAASILRGMVHTGALVSHRGAKGGFMLPRPASELTWADMVQSIHGSLAWTPCVAGANHFCQHCPRAGDCPIRVMAERLQRDNMSMLRAVRLTDTIARP